MLGLALSSLLLVGGFALPLPASSAPVALATSPLANSTTTAVLPNLMFILDNSGSMDSDYLPDWVPNSYCKGISPTTKGATSDCSDGTGNRPPYNNADYNKIYYDPSITYSPPWDATLATPANKTSYTGTGSTPKDGYGIQSTSTTTLTTSYPDLEYCTDTSYTDCLRNDNYLLPGVVNGKNYTTIHGTTATGSKTFATGPVDAPTTTSATAGPFYYVMIPGEYCSDRDQTTCIAATAPSAGYPYAAKVRWCKTTDLKSDNPPTNGCKLVQDSVYKYARYPTVITTAGTAAGLSIGRMTASNMPQSASIGGRTRPTCIISASSSSCSAGTVADCNAQAAGGKSVFTSLKLISTAHPAPGTELLTESFTYCNGSGTSNTRNNGLAAAIMSKIGNGFTASLPGSTNVIEITAPDGTYNAATRTVSLTSATLTITTVFAGGATAVAPVAVPGSFQRINIVSGQTYGNIVVGGTTIVDRSQRTDCAAKPNCSYAEELSNFANWYAWYRTRMQMMKSAASLAFKPIDNKYRVGFITINGATATTNYLKVDTFIGGVGNQKANWYAKLFAANPDSYTPLRGALSRVGRIFAGKNPLAVSGGDDPMQYSCQQNFTLLTTDGYWNTYTETTSYSSNNVTGAAVGNLDGGSTARPMFEGPIAVSNSLADIAKYYYDTDLRTSAFGNCTGALGLDVCENNVFVSNTDNNLQQHMTTFTLGLGVDGVLSYQSDYKTATSGDYYLLKNGLSKTVGGVSTPVNWPDPNVSSSSNTVVERIDDLWHAAVNGQGTYFSAKNPSELSSGLNDALSSIGSKVGAGAAAATSTLNPVAGDNFAYVASYTTQIWTGNLEARTIDLVTGAVSKAATWCVENTVSGTCTAPGSVVASLSGGSTVYNCVTPVASSALCAAPGVYNSTTLTCDVEMPIACTGRMTVPGVVGASSDGRTIYTKNSTGTSLVPFVIGNLNATDFDATKQSSLSQWSTLTAAQKTALTGDNLVNFLRGQNGHEDRASNLIDNRVYRYRSAVLSDAVESQPVYVGKPKFSFSDTGYDAYKTAQAGRVGTVYMGANDGMLHGFDSVTGDERWAYVPSMVIPNMWKLADKNYSTMHTYYANGSPIIGDIYDGATWRTILVAGLNGGGRGYYALDVTNPAAPTLLWEFTTASDPDLGYSFGRPVITKKDDGTWVVLVTSGYNNTSPGDGKGYLYVLNASTGVKLDKLATTVGDTTTPSGLSRIATQVIAPAINHTALYTYGGDLQGNLWRFDINSGAVVKFAVLKDSSGVVQPITTAPTIGEIDGKRVVFVGTGKYLETSDLINTQQQTLYAIKDPDDYPTATPVATLVNPRTTLVQQTISTSGATRTASTNPVDWSTDRGWYINLPDSGERQNVEGQLFLGTIVIPTTVPSNTVCNPGGYGWLNYFDYKTGSAPADSGSTVVSSKSDAPIVGVNIFVLPSGKVVTTVITTDNPNPEAKEVPFKKLGFQGKRVIWREYIPE